MKTKNFHVKHEFPAYSLVRRFLDSSSPNIALSSLSFYKLRWLSKLKMSLMDLSDIEMGPQCIDKNLQPGLTAQTVRHHNFVHTSAVDLISSCYVFNHNGNLYCKYMTLTFHACPIYQGTCISYQPSIGQCNVIIRGHYLPNCSVDKDKWKIWAWVADAPDHLQNYGSGI